MYKKYLYYSINPHIISDIGRQNNDNSILNNPLDKDDGLVNKQIFHKHTGFLHKNNLILKNIHINPKQQLNSKIII